MRSKLSLVLTLDTLFIYCLLALIYLSLFTLSSQSSAQSNSAPRLDVANAAAAIALPRYLNYARKPQNAEVSPLAERRIVPANDAFSPLDSSSVQFGYSTDEFWFKVETINSSAAAIDLVLTTGVSFLEPLSIFTEAPDGGLTELLTIDANHPYSARPLPSPKITVPISWQPGEAKTLLIYAVSNSGISMQLALLPAPILAAEIRNLDITFALISGILGTLIFVNLFHYLAAKRLAHLFYAIQELAVLLFLLHGEGLAFKYLWPDSPVWNAHATMVFGHLTNLSAGLFAIYFLSLRRRAPRFFKIIFAINSISAVMLLATPFIGSQFSNQVGLLVSGVGAVVLFSAGVRVWLNGYQPARYYVTGWSFLAIATMLFFLSNLGFISLSFPPILAIRIGILLEALLLSYALSDQLRHIDERATKAQKELLLATQASFKDQQEKAELDKSRLLAEKALLEKDIEIAKERHDIRQPIYSLRLALLAGKKSTDKIEVEVFQRALDHMEQLLAAKEDVIPSNSGTIDSFGQLFTQLQREFENEAAKLNTKISVFESNRTISAPLLPLKRVLSNLVANAVRHSGSKKILIGLRKKNSEIRLLVADNGRGISSESATKKGEGLGMQIIDELCIEQKWTLNCHTEPNVGTCFTLSIPL